jgi:hypothetical protein
MSPKPPGPQARGTTATTGTAGTPGPGARTARAWYRTLPPYAHDEFDVALLGEVDRLPARVRREVLAGWTRAAAAGLYDAALLSTIVEVVVAEPPHPVPLGA